MGDQREKMGSEIVLRTELWWAELVGGSVGSLFTFIAQVLWCVCVYVVCWFWFGFLAVCVLAVCVCVPE